MLFKKFRDLILGGFLVLGSVMFLTVLIPIGIQHPGNIEQAALAPDFWIKIIVWGLLLLGLIILWDGYKVFRTDNDMEASTEQRLPFPRNLFAVSFVILFLFLYQQFVGILGIVATSMIAVFVMSVFAGYRNWIVVGLVTLLLPTGLYYFFLKVANVPMPLGLFE